MSELLAALGNVSPLIAAIVVITLLVLYAIDKLTGSNGPVSRFLHWLSTRELNRLRRQAELERERRKLLRDAESETVTELRQQLADLLEEVGWYRKEANDLRRRDRHSTEWERAMAVWLAENLSLIRAAGSAVSDPPGFEPLPPLLVLDDDVAELADEGDNSGRPFRRR